MPQQFVFKHANITAVQWYMTDLAEMQTFLGSAYVSVAQDTAMNQMLLCYYNSDQEIGDQVAEGDWVVAQSDGSGFYQISDDEIQRDYSPE